MINHSLFSEKMKLADLVLANYRLLYVFPCFDIGIGLGETDDYNIQVYEGNHSNIDAALNDLKNIIIKYLPDECTLEKYREVLIDLFLFESDLSRHALLEDPILVSLVERVEHNIKVG